MRWVNIDFPDWITALVAALFILYYAIFDALADAWIFRDYRYTKGANGELHWMDYASGVVSRMADENKKWHRFQALQQGGVILVVAFLSGFWQVVLLGLGAFWLLHDGIVNIVGLGRGFFFVGTTAWIDRIFQKLKQPEAAMAIVKIALVAAGILSFIIF